MNETLGIILAGDSSLEMGEVARYRSTGAIPFAARYRLVDFVLSNMVNSGIDRVGVPTQTHYRSLMDHLGSGAAWDLNRRRHGLVILPPFLSNQGREIDGGTVDILNSIQDYINVSNRKYVLVAGSDLVYNTRYDELAEFHIANNADITILYNSVPPQKQPVKHVGLRVDGNGRVTDMEINPSVPTTAYASMGVMFMKREFLEFQLNRCVSHGQHDLVKDILLHLDEFRVFGLEYKGYVGRISSIEEYYQRNMEMLDQSVFEPLFAGADPVYTKVKDQVPTIYGDKAQVTNSIVADGCRINGRVENSILFRGVQIEEDAIVKNSIVMQDAQLQHGVNLQYAILDKSVIIRNNKTLIGQESYPVVIGKNVIV